MHCVTLTCVDVPSFVQIVTVNESLHLSCCMFFWLTPFFHFPFALTAQRHVSLRCLCVVKGMSFVVALGSRIHNDLTMLTCHCE